MDLWQMEGNQAEVNETEGGFVKSCVNAPSPYKECAHHVLHAYIYIHIHI